MSTLEGNNTMSAIDKMAFFASQHYVGGIPTAEDRTPSIVFLVFWIFFGSWNIVGAFRIFGFIFRLMVASFAAQNAELIFLHALMVQLGFWALVGKATRNFTDFLVMSLDVKATTDLNKAIRQMGISIFSLLGLLCLAVATCLEIASPIIASQYLFEGRLDRAAIPYKLHRAASLTGVAGLAVLLFTALPLCLRFHATKQLTNGELGFWNMLTLPWFMMAAIYGAVITTGGRHTKAYYVVHATPELIAMLTMAYGTYRTYRRRVAHISVLTALSTFCNCSCDACGTCRDRRGVSAVSAPLVKPEEQEQA